MWNSTGKATCMCAAGYRLENKKCIIRTSSTFLLISKNIPAIIKGITLNNNSETMLPLTGFSMPRAFDYSVETRSVYISDTEKNIIVNISLVDGKKSIVLNKNLDKCDGLAIDWMGKNLYWTDEGKRSISVLKLSNITQRKTLIQHPDLRPSVIALNPKLGILYFAHRNWTVKNFSYIGSAWMDGRHQEKLVTDSISWVTGLVVDYNTGRLYWSDASLNTIESVDFDGKNRRLEINKQITNPFSIAFYNNTIFTIEGLQGNIVKFDLKQKILQKIDRNGSPLQLKIYDSESQKGRNLCGTNPNQCPELCLTIPKTFSCVCSDGYDMINSTCIKQSNYMQPSVCPPDTFQCRKKKHCISKKKLCDGEDNCGDGSDESRLPGGPCENKICDENHFICDGSYCISRNWLCDGQYDCKDRSDEDPEHCKSKCSKELFMCKSTRRCIPKNWTCDGHVDCGENDMSDEENCGKY